MGRLIIIIIFTLLFQGCSSEKETAEIIKKDSSDTYLSKSKIDQWISAEVEDEKIKLVQEFLEHRNTLLEQEMDSSRSEILPIIEVEKFYHSADYLAVAIGNLNDWKVSFLVLAFNGKHYEVMHHKLVNAHYRSPKIEQLKDSFLTLEHEVSGGTDFLEEQVTAFYLDTTEQALKPVMIAPKNSNTGGYLKYRITPSLSWKGSDLKIKMNYKFWICKGVINDFSLDIETVKNSYKNFTSCEEQDANVLLKSFSIFNFTWHPIEKQFNLINGKEWKWSFFKDMHGSGDFPCNFYRDFESDIITYNQDLRTIKRLIKLCELEDE